MQMWQDSKKKTTKTKTKAEIADIKIYGKKRKMHNLQLHSQLHAMHLRRNSSQLYYEIWISSPVYV